MPAPVDHQICPAVCVLMKLSFDEEHRHAMNELGKTKCIYLTLLKSLLEMLTFIACKDYFKYYVALFYHRFKQIIGSFVTSK